MTWAGPGWPWPVPESSIEFNLLGVFLGWNRPLGTEEGRTERRDGRQEGMDVLLHKGERGWAGRIEEWEGWTA